MENVSFDDISAYMNLLDSARQPNEIEQAQADNNMDLEEIDDRIKILEDFDAIIQDRVESLRQLRTKRLKNVKMLRKVPFKDNRIAC